MRARPSGLSLAYGISTPIRRICPDCCARKASGHATAEPPTSVMKSRRLMERPLRAGDCSLSHCPALEAMLCGSDAGATFSTCLSFDDLVGEQLHRTRHLDAECLRGFHVDDQLELARPHHWEIAGLFNLENAADEDAGLPIRGETIGAITDEPAGQSEGSPFLNRGHRIAFGQGNDLFAAVVKHHIGGYDEPACARLDQS